MKNVTVTIQNARLIPAVNCLNLLIQQLRPGKINMVCSMIGDTAAPKAVGLQKQMEGLRKLHIEADEQGTLKTRKNADGSEEYAIKEGHAEAFNAEMTELLEASVELSIPELTLDDFDKIEAAYTGTDALSLAPLVVFLAPEPVLKAEK